MADQPANTAHCKWLETEEPSDIKHYYRKVRCLKRHKFIPFDVVRIEAKGGGIERSVFQIIS